MSNGQAYPYPPVAEADFLSKEEIELLKRTILKYFTEDEQMSFIRLCQRTKLDPFTRQIYATKRMQKVRDADGTTKKMPTLVPVTSVIGLTAVADRTGNYEGCEIFWSAADGKWRTEWLEDEPPAAAKCIVYRHGRPHPEVAIARWMSYAGQTFNYETKKWELSDFWEKMPDFMLGKCAKAAALRGAFPDPLNNVFIREELESNITDSELETEAVDRDEAKIAENQRREEDRFKRREELEKAGVKFVETKPGPPRPTPAEALEPAFAEDKIPEKPKAKPTRPAPVPVAPVQPAQQVQQQEPPDEIDMGPYPPPTQQKAAADFPPEGSAAATAEEAPEPQWQNYVTRSFEAKSTNYYKKKIGDLSRAQLDLIEAKWLPAIRDQWDDANEAQRADYAMFEAAIAYYKMAKPW